MVAGKNDSDSSCLVTRGEISSNGSIDCSPEDPVFIASDIPAAFQQFMITEESFSDVISLQLSEKLSGNLNLGRLCFVFPP